MKATKYIVYIPEFRAPIEPQRKILAPIAEIKTGPANNQEELISIVSKVDAILVTTKPQMTRNVIESSRKLKVIAKYGVGVDNIDLQAATDMGIPVTNAAGINSNATAELTIGLILALLRRIQEAKQLMQKGLWKDDRYLGAELAGSTIGIIGYGNVAKLVIRKLQGFDIKKILVFSESKKHEKSEFSNVEFAGLTRLLKESNIVSIHKTLTARSRGLIGEHELRIMRNTTYLINTSRGALIKESALIGALKKGLIAGAALDVFEEEPLNSHNPLLVLNNVVLTPHIGAATLKARLEGVTIVAQNIRDILQGKKPDLHYIVNPEVFQVIHKKLVV